MTRLHDLTRMLRPRTVAVIGGAPAARVVRECNRIGYAGAIWPIHPEKPSVEGHPCFRSVADLPDAPDVAFVGVNRFATIDIVRALAERGAGGVVSYASGFREVGPEGSALQDRLVEAAGDMPVVGPNCYGFVNCLDGIPVWPDLHGGRRVERGVGLVTQSSNIACNLTMSRRGLPVAMVLALGNQAMVGLPDAIVTYARDPRITAIGVHIEGVSDADRLAAAVAEAQRAGKPVVALKAGKSADGAALTLSHTASLSGSHAVLGAFLARIGVAEVDSVSALLEALKLLHVGGPMRGRQVVSMQCSGGEAALMADALDARTLETYRFTEADVARIRPTTHELVTISNPFDYHTFDWGHRERLARTFAEVMRGGQHMTTLLLDWPPAALGGNVGDWDAAALALGDAGAETGGRTSVIATVPETMTEDIADGLVARGVTPLFGVQDALTAMEAAARLGTTAARPVRPAGTAPTGERTVLAEVAAKAALAAFGLPVPAGRVCRSEDEAAAAGAAIGFPVVAKVAGDRLLHKSEEGGVLLDLRDEAALRAAWRTLAPKGDAVLVEPMVGKGAAVAELILGVARDPVVGLHLVVGAGGILAELLRDAAILLLPTTREEVLEALAGLRVAPLLRGFRGKPPGDLQAVADAVLALARYAEANADRLEEVDVNPLIVLPKGAVAVDALVILREP